MSNKEDEKLLNQINNLNTKKWKQTHTLQTADDLISRQSIKNGKKYKDSITNQVNKNRHIKCIQEELDYFERKKTSWWEKD